MEYIKLGDLFKITSGGTPSKKNNEFYDGGSIPWIKTGDLKVKYINSSSEYITELAVEKSSAKLFPRGTVLIAMYGATIGATSILNIEATTNQACCAFLPNNKIKAEYLYYFFIANKEKIVSMGVGGAQPNISATILKEIKIPFSSLEKQISIVNLLDKAQELINKRKEQIEALDELVKSQFIEMFGDPFNDEKGFGTNKLGEVTGVNPKKAEIKDLDKELLVSFVPMDRVGEKGEFNPEVSKSIGEVYSGFTYFRENDVLFAKITPCMENSKGAVAVNLSNGIGFGSTEFHVLRPLREKSNSYWIYHLTTLIEFRRLAERKMTGSAGQKRVPTDFLNNIQVVVPPIELQNQFADFVKQVDKLKFEMEKSLKELEDNFNSLMQRAFKGELFN